MDRKSAEGVEPYVADFLCADRYGSRIPRGALTVIAGWPGEGKSLASRDLAAAVTKYGGKVAMSNTEDPEGSVRIALEVAGADLAKVEFIEPNFPRDLEAFVAYIREEKPDCIVLDPIAAHFGGIIYAEADFRAMFKPIKDALGATGCSLIGIHHTISRIRKNDHPLKALGGPQGSLKGTARSVWLFGRNPDNEAERVLAYVKDNVGASKTSVLMEWDVEDVYIEGRKAPASQPVLHVLDQDCRISATDIIHQGAGEGKEVKQSIAQQWLTEFLMLGEQPTSDIFTEGRLMGFARATVQRSAQTLMLQRYEKVMDDGKKVAHWDLPENHPARIDVDGEFGDLLGGESA